MPVLEIILSYLFLSFTVEKNGTGRGQWE